MVSAISKQTWTVGERVNVGFLRGLLITAYTPTPGDYRPDTYTLRADSGAEYIFTPHFGIARVK